MTKKKKKQRRNNVAKKPSDADIIKQLRAELEAMPNPDEPLVSDGSETYSARGLLEEIEKGTEFGQQLLEARRKLQSAVARSRHRKRRRKAT